MTKPETRPGLYLGADAVAGSVHEGVTCVECHQDAKDLPHSAKLNLATCAAACASAGGSASVARACAREERLLEAVGGWLDMAWLTPT